MKSMAGATFTFPTGDGRLCVCRVLLDPCSRVQRGGCLGFMTWVIDFIYLAIGVRRKHRILVACCNWIGNRIPKTDDPALRTILELNHHSYVDQPNVLWISRLKGLPEDFIYIGTIIPTSEEIEIKCSILGGWSSVTRQPLIQWRWDNDRDALLAEEAKAASLLSLCHDRIGEQMRTMAGAAFAFPMSDGRFCVCRVLLDPGSHVQRGEMGLDFVCWGIDAGRQYRILVACCNWIGNRIPQADDPSLRTILELNHHSYVDQPNVLWIRWPQELPEDFIYIGTIVPTAKETAIKGSNHAEDWSALTRHPLIQWRWDNDRDALLADEMKEEEYRRARLILRDKGVVIDSHGLTHRGVRLAWDQIREVAVEGSETEHSNVPFLTITSDAGEFTMGQGINVFPSVVNALDGLPKFPSLEFRKALKSSMYDGKVIIWRREITERGEELPSS